MHTHVQKQSPAQKVAPSAFSVFDASSQSESLQHKADIANNAAQRAEAPRPNNTGMPDNLKSGIESLSGFSMDDVRVHYNSSKPATVQALAYTQGTDIHVAPGQEKHLPHEAWHVAQQMAGRVSPTTNINGMPVNDNAGLEHEADVMGEKAIQCKAKLNNLYIQKSITNGNSVQRTMPNMEDVIGTEYKGDTGPATPSLKHPLIAEKKYERKNSFTVFSKNDAIKAIATEAGIIGDNCKKSQMDAKDHFYCIIPASYNKTSLTMTYHFGKEHPGYVTEVKDPNKTRTMKPHAELKKYFADLTFTSKDPKERAKKMKAELDNPSSQYYLKDDQKKLRKALTKVLDALITDDENKEKYSKEFGFNYVINKNLVTPVATDFFSDLHKETGSNKLITETDADLSESAADAYTKLAGEGARFLCVRNNIDKISDNTVFHAPSENQGITFSDLWCSWGATFDCQFNIPDNVIITELLSTTTKEKTPKPKQKNTLKKGRNGFTTPKDIGDDHIELKE